LGRTSATIRPSAEFRELPWRRLSNFDRHSDAKLTTPAIRVRQHGEIRRGDRHRAGDGAVHACADAGRLIDSAGPADQARRTLSGGGGLTDTLARSIANPLAKALGQAIIVETKPCAGTLVAAQAVARSPADGFTLPLATSTTPAISPALAHIRSSKLDVLATTTPKRSSMLPDVPTFAEAGYPAVQAVACQGIVSPTGIPRALLIGSPRRSARACAASRLGRAARRSAAKRSVPRRRPTSPIS
jgi:hypothetical protein